MRERLSDLAGSNRASVVVLAATNAMAMGSSFLVFVVVARRSSEETLGMFAVALAIAAAANQVVDSGLGQYAVREASRLGEADLVMTWLIRQRGRIFALLVTPILATVTAFIGFSAIHVFLIIILVFLNAWYGVSILNQQSRQKFASVAKIQVANAALFTTAASAACLSFDELSLTAALALPIAGLAPVVVWDVLRNRRLLLGDHLTMEHAPDRRHFTGLLLANVVTSNLDTVVLGAANPAIGAAYAAVQRPAQGVSTISLAVASVSLPKFAAQTRREVGAHVRQATKFIPLALALGFVAYGIGLVALPMIYNSDLADPAAFGLLVSAYALGIAFSVYSNSLVTAGRTKNVTQVAVLQAVIVAIFVAFAVRQESALLLAIGILVARAAALGASGLALWSMKFGKAGTSW